MRRSKENTKYWNDRILKLIELDPKYKQIKYIYNSLKLLLQEKYPFIKEHNNIQFLKDVVYLDRIMRLYREGEEESIKENLEQEFIINNLK